MRQLRIVDCAVDRHRDGLRPLDDHAVLGQQLQHRLDLILNLLRQPTEIVDGMSSGDTLVAMIR